MDPNPTPFPGTSQSQSQSQSQSRKPKIIQRKSSEAPKSHDKETTLIHSRYREKRVFGTARNPNVMTKPMLPEFKTAAKKKTLSLVVPGRTSAEISKTTPKKSPVVENGVGKMKKTVNFNEKVVVDDHQNKEKKAAETDDVSRAQTPLRSPFSIKPRALGTPFLSAEKCSKCRFDKLETASYWIAQIKLADSVGKHFVSAVFFKLAHECRAEPLRNIKVELKKYMARHEQLGNEEEWKALCIGYGLVKDESRLREQEYEEQQEAKIEFTERVSTEEDKNVIMYQATTNEEDAADGDQIWFLVS